MTKEPFKIKRRDVRDGNANRIIHRYEPAPSVTVEDILQPAAWSQIARYFNVGDLIEVIWQDNSKECMLRVLDRNDNMALVALRGDVIEYHKNDMSDAEENSAFYIKFAGPQRKHEIRRKDNHELIAGQIATKSQAESELANLTKRYGS